MSKSSPTAPTPVDPAALIAADTEANRITTFTPLGDLRFGEVGTEGQFVPSTGGAASFVDLSPETLFALNLEQEISRILGTQAAFRSEELPSGAVDFSGLPTFPSTLDTSGFPSVSSEIDFSGFTPVPGSVDFSGLTSIDGLDLSRLSAFPSGFDFSNFTSIPGTIDASGFGDLPSGIDFSGLTALPGIDDFSEDAKRVEEATFQRALSLLNPEFAQQEERLRQRLANQGIPIEAVAASGTGEGGAPLGEFTRFERNRNEALQNAAFDAVQAGRAEQSRLFGLATSARGQQVGEQLQDIQVQFGVRSQEFNEAIAAAQQAMASRGVDLREVLAEQDFSFEIRGTELDEMLRDVVTRFGVRSQEFSEVMASIQQAMASRGINLQEALAGTDLGFRSRQQALAESLQGIDLSRTARQQGISEELTTRSTAFNELMALLGGSQVAVPQFAAPQPIDILGPELLAFQGTNLQFQAQQQQQSDLLSGLFGLGSAGITGAFSLSDRRLKTDIRRVGQTDDGLPIYTFRFRGSMVTQMGVMADEVEAVNPEAVTEINGLKHVYYEQLK